MENDLKTELALAKKRAARFKKACHTAEQLLETKSRELFEANQKLHQAQRSLKDDINQATYELNVSNRRLQKSLDEKSNFIGQMSHEVRTPLNAIIGLSEVLLKTEFEATQHDYIKTIHSGAGALIVLLDDMLDITKIEAGRVELKPEPVDIRSVLKNVVTMFQQTALNKGLSLDLKVSSTIPAKVSIDKGRYKQIINNLITNSVKNTHEGGIVIQATYVTDKTGSELGTLTTRIIDSGVGIPEDKRNRIFNAYEQLGNATQGVGLGLAICQQLSELMMGKITCKSTVGRGSTFEVSLPVTAIAQQKEEPSENKQKAPIALAPLKILVAEDNPTNQKVITAQLSLLGQHADIANNGKEAYERLIQMKEQDQYDVLICDILMPVMDGEQTIKKIRATNSDISNSYCIALTASNYQDQRKKLLEAGFDAFLSKPASLEQLSDALSALPHKVKLDSSTINPAEKEKADIKAETTPNAFDFTFLKTQFGDAHKSIFAEIAPVFLEHAYLELQALEASIANANIDAISKTSHSMKGAASSIGLTELAELLRQIEDKPRAINVAALGQKVRTLMDELKPSIEHELNQIQ